MPTYSIPSPDRNYSIEVDIWFKHTDDDETNHHESEVVKFTIINNPCPDEPYEWLTREYVQEKYN